jgi:CubicO group peptidase (beta-lactamase class C family)
LATNSNLKFFGSNKIEREEVACKLIKQITGRTIAELLQERIFEPLELAHTEWATVPKENLVCDFQAADGYASVRIESNEGHERNIYSSTRDLAYWGYFFV